LKLAEQPLNVTQALDHPLADISRAKSELGYNPSTDFINQHSTVAEWYRTSYPAGNQS
jgi:nucleoside-diphosphate-sugar epimerase